MSSTIGTLAERHNTVHAAGADDEIKKVKHLSVDTNVKVVFASDKNSRFKYTQDPADETYPQHYTMPVQVYIGGELTASQRQSARETEVTYADGTVRKSAASRLTRESIGVSGAYDSAVRGVVVGRCVTEIDPGALSGLTGLSSVDMRSCLASVVEVPEGCCDGCSNLVSFYFPES